MALRKDATGSCASNHYQMSFAAHFLSRPPCLPFRIDRLTTQTRPLRWSMPEQWTQPVSLVSQAPVQGAMLTSI